MHVVLRNNKNLYGHFKFGADLSEIVEISKKSEEVNQIDVTINN